MRPLGILLFCHAGLEIIYIYNSVIAQKCYLSKSSRVLALKVPFITDFFELLVTYLVLSLVYFLSLFDKKQKILWSPFLIS